MDSPLCSLCKTRPARECRGSCVSRTFKPCRKRPVIEHARPAIIGESIGDELAEAGDFVVRTQSGMSSGMRLVSAKTFAALYDWVE